MNWTVINEDRTNLPEPCSDVLVTYIRPGITVVASATTEIAYFDGDRLFYNINTDTRLSNNVIAWMYLPKPYTTQP